MTARASGRRREQLLLTVMALTAGLVVPVVIAAARDTPDGVSRERTAMHALGGTGQTFDTISWCLARLPAACVLTCLVLVMALGVRTARRRAAAALTLFACTNVSAQLLKDALGRVLEPAAATTPSGHAVLALSAACAIVLVVPARRRCGALVVAGALATLGCVGTIAAYWHVPGDVLSALSLVTAWLVVVQILFVPRQAVRRRPEPRRFRSRTFAAALSGAAGCVVTFLGWGTVLNDMTPARRAAGLFDLVVLPLAAAAVVAAAARRVPEEPARTH